MYAKTITPRRRYALLLTLVGCGAGSLVSSTFARAPIEGVERSRPLVPATSAPAEDNAPAATSEHSRDATPDESTSAGEIAGWLPDQWHTVGPITAQCLYTGEAFDKLCGGLPGAPNTARYRGNLDLTLTLDTAAANWWEDGEVFVYFQHAHGTTLTPHFVGDGQYYSNIDTGPKTQSLTQLQEDCKVEFANRRAG